VGRKICHTNSFCNGAALIFTPLRLDGAYLIDIEPIEDSRGFFARSWCSQEFKKMGLISKIEQCSFSSNLKQGTLRGMHYQAEPYQEAKLVRCTAGSIYDVILDIRPESPTFKEWLAFELSAKNMRTLYIPYGFAHGFQSLEDHTEVLYMVSESFRPEYSASVRWNDPKFGIVWPDVEVRLMSDKDKFCKDFPL
jgi:dTDP-4-dehydrorhamnose 3,5-epimerase